MYYSTTLYMYYNTYIKIIFILFYLLICFIIVFLYYNKIYKNMSKVYLRQKSESQEIVDKETGDISDLIETFIVDEDTWFKLYTKTFASYCDNLTGNAIKFFSKCLKYSQEDKGEGNYFFINDPYLQKELIEYKVKSNTTKYLKELIDNGFIYKIRRSQYGINPEVAYCGTKHSRARLMLKLIKE